VNVQCQLCPKNCLLEPGQSGECRVRINIDGVLRTVVYGYPCSINIDPVEKKPLFHFLPGTPILSIATVGCNLHCLNCQNWEISQANPEDASAIFQSPGKLQWSPQDIVDLARQYKCPSIAYTYTEPIIYYEYTYDTARLARQAGIRNVLVTAGYANDEPWKKLLEYIDAANIDLKAFSDEFYAKICSATLQPVLNTLIAAKTAGVWVEVTNLIIPTLNDQPNELRQLARWVRQNLGSETPLHFSRFFPHYKLQNLPPTPLNTLDQARQIALEEGLSYVYIGNIRSEQGQNSYCPKCKKLLVERVGYTILQNNVQNDCCPACKMQIYGVWK